MLLAPVLVAQEPQSPIVHTTEGPAYVHSEMRIFVNGKELTPSEVDQLRKEGVHFIKRQNQPTATQPVAPVVQEGGRVFIHGHELPPEVAAHMIESGIVEELQAPVRATQTIAPMERPKVEFEPACRLYPAAPAAQPEAEGPKPFRGQPCNCGPAPKPCTCTPETAYGPAEAPAPEKPACGDPNISMKVYINGQEVSVPMGEQVNITRTEEGVVTVTPEPPTPAAQPEAEGPKPFCGQPCNCGPAPKPCTCTPDNACGPTRAPSCDTKPAEPDTPELPTPAVEAEPECTSSFKCETKVIINGQEVQIPANTHSFRVIVDSDGKTKVTPLP